MTNYSLKPEYIEIRPDRRNHWSRFVGRVVYSTDDPDGWGVAADGDHRGKPLRSRKRKRLERRLRKRAAPWQRDFDHESQEWERVEL